MKYSYTFKIILWTFKAIVEIVYLPIHLWRLFQTSQKCSPIQNKILLLPATELTERIRKREISCVSVIEAYIARVQQVNPLLNAVIENRFEMAVEEAKKFDDFVRNTDLNVEQIKEKYPLLGVPITIKGAIAVAGMLQTGGRVDHLIKAEEDAPVVKYAKSAGAIPLLTSNVPELCLNWETRNKLIGVTSNPFDTRRTPGGSSGGEASLIASGASVIGIGSDIAGSLRLPAHYCGIWGHKPSARAVSTVGHYPDCKQKEDWNDVFVLGPLARYVGDLRLLLSVIVEPSYKNVLKLDEKVEVKKLKIYYAEDLKLPLANKISSEVIAALRNVISHFNTVCNTKCKEVDIPLMEYGSELSYLRLAIIDDVENVFKGKGEGAYQELFKFLIGKSIHEFNSIFYGILRQNIDLIPVKTMNGVMKDIDMLKQNFLHLLGDDGVFVTPTSPCEASYHGDVYRKLWDAGYMSIFNVLGFPVTNCPVTFSRNNLPIGIQVVAAPNFDRLTLAVAEEIERVFGGWKFN